MLQSHRCRIFPVLVWLVAASCGCSGIYYKTMEAFGYHKRDILVSSVEKARDSQEEAKEQFQTALEKFTSLINFKGGELEDTYNKLNDEYEESKDRAEAVSGRIEDVEEVADALFQEWEGELDAYSNERLRSLSEEKLQNTRSRYSKLIGAMKHAEAKIEPVLKAFGDQVLFLKHNLNARAIDSLKDELVSVETDVASLIKDMEASVNEANQFIDQITQEDSA